MELKKKLLVFATGSDRAPINGLSSLRFVITRSGPDSDRLPTSHTSVAWLLAPPFYCVCRILRGAAAGVNV